MRLSLRSLLAVFVSLCAGIGQSHAADIAHLTGIKLLSANDMSGGFNNASWFDTVGGNWDFNVYVTGANTGNNGAFVNSGDSAATSIDIPINLGTYAFWMFTVSTSDNYWGMNLFFDQDQVNPKITAITNTKTNATDPQFVANPALNVPVLAGSTLVASPQSVVYQTNNANITLTSYFYASSSLYQMNRVSAHNSSPDSANNSVSFITLTVTSVPEPSTYALAAIASGVMATLALRRKGFKSR